MLYQSAHAYLFPFWKIRPKVWHSTYQMPRSRPRSGAIVQTIHDLAHFYLRTDYHRPWIRHLLQRSLDCASIVVAISDFVRQDIYVHLQPKCPVKVIYNGCDRYTGPVTPPPFAVEKPFLFTIGKMAAKKNFKVLPCLLEGNDLELYIAGPRFNPEYEKEIMAEAARRGVAERVHTIGPLPEAVKHWFYSHCLAFVFPSLQEGFGFPPLEAMHYGKPVFLSRHTSLPEVGGDRVFYFNYDFEPEQMKVEFATGMAQYGHPPFTPKEISAHTDKFSWQKAAQSYIALYRSLA